MESAFQWRAVFPRTIRPSTVFVGIALLPAIVHLTCFIYVLVARARYPMDLEWLEGAQLYEAYRLAHGQPVYVSPDSGFVPAPYPPLFDLVVSVIGRAFGFDYWNGRVVSDISLLAVMGVQSATLVRAAPSRRAGYVLAAMSAACVAASYHLLRASMDLARVDTMGVALVVVAGWVSQAPPLGWKRSVGLGLLLCAALYTKQTNLFYAIWMIFFVARRDRCGALLAAAVTIAFATGTLVVLQRASHGWFWMWISSMRHQGVVPVRCLVAALVTSAAAAALGAAYVAFDRRGWLGDATRFWCGMLAAAIPASIGMLNPGGWLNNLNGLVLIALLVALLFSCDALRGIHTEASVRWATATLSAFLLGAIYDPTNHVPDSASRHEVEALHETVRSLDGDVLLPMYPFVAVRDGKTSPQLSLVAYLCTVGPGRVNADAAAAIRERDPKWVLLFGHPQEKDIPTWLGSRYVSESLDLHVQALQETTGGSMTLVKRTASARE